jgi:uncharacterized alpha/beta hydrolase family protein
MDDNVAIILSYNKMIIVTKQQQNSFEQQRKELTPQKHTHGTSGNGRSEGGMENRFKKL